MDMTAVIRIEDFPEEYDEEEWFEEWNERLVQIPRIYLISSEELRMVLEKE